MRIPPMTIPPPSTSNGSTAVAPKPFRIGPHLVDPPLLQAPMAGFTNYAYRQVVREFGGVGLQATEMVHAKGFLWITHCVLDELPICSHTPCSI